MQPDVEAFFCWNFVCFCPSNTRKKTLLLHSIAWKFSYLDFFFSFHSRFQLWAQKIEIKRKHHVQTNGPFSGVCFWLISAGQMKKDFMYEHDDGVQTVEDENASQDCWILHEITLNCHEIGRSAGTRRRLQFRRNKNRNKFTIRGDQSAVNNHFSFDEFGKANESILGWIMDA